jgi:hypothetical protein
VIILQFKKLKYSMTDTTFIEDDVLTSDTIPPSNSTHPIYLTGDEFEKRVMEGLKNRLIKNGYLH